MEMKKTIIGGIVVASVIAAVVTSIMTNKTSENKIKSVTKEDILWQDGEKNITSDEKVTKVLFGELWDGNMVWLDIHGYKENSSELVWEYMTSKVQIDNGNIKLQYLGENISEGLVIINEGGTLKALDMQTGEEKWTNDDCDCGMYDNTKIKFTGNGKIYVCFKAQNILLVIDVNGKTLSRYDFSCYKDEIPYYDERYQNVSINPYNTIEPDESETIELCYGRGDGYIHLKKIIIDQNTGEIILVDMTQIDDI